MKSTNEKTKYTGTEGGQAHRNDILGSFLREHSRQVFKVALRLARNPDEAQDLVQETAYRVLDKWHRYDPAKPLMPWFLTIMYHVCTDRRIAAGRRAWAALDAPIDHDGGRYYADILSDDDGDLTRRLEDAEAEKLARRAFRRLHRDDRALIQLWESGMSYADIASNLRIPVGTVRSRIFRTRRALRNHLPELVGANQ
jgi:RNA polymerase sigma factor (sigma-70 family)